MKQILIITLATSILGLAACEDHKTIEWYDQHPEERAAKLKWCEEDATRVTNADCMNATKSRQVQNVTNGTRTFGKNYQFK